MKHFQLITLGRTALLTPSGEDADLGTRRRKLALLAVLALSRKAPTREALTEMFWGDEDEDRARHSLSDALSHLRRVLGREAVAARKEIVELNVAGVLAVDATEVEAAHESRDWRRVVERYGGDFLADVFVPGSDSFDRWRARERERYQRYFVQACEVLVHQLARAAQFDEARLLTLRWLAAAPQSHAGLQALVQLGLHDPTSLGRRAALDAAELQVALLAREHEARVDPRIEQSIVALRSLVATDIDIPSEMPRAESNKITQQRSSDSSDATSATPAVRVETADITGAVNRTRSGNWTRWAGLAAGLLAVASLSVAVTSMRRNSADDLTNQTPVVAITEIRSTSPDSDAWLGDGVREMISADLMRAQSVGVVPAARVRDAIARAMWTSPLDAARQAELARRVHATWALSGVVAHNEGGYVADLVLRDARNGDELKRWTVSGSNVLAVADQAAAVVLGTAGDRSPGAHLSEVETSNTDAFRWYVSGQAAMSKGDMVGAANDFDAAIAADSAFVSAIIARLHLPATWSDKATYNHLRVLFDRASSRMTEWDRLEDAEYLAFHNGEHARAESLARQLVARYPRDSRALQILRDVAGAHGNFAAAESAMVRLLALDSLAINAGGGPCSSCAGFLGLSDLRATRGDLAGAQHVAEQWVAVQPAAPESWRMLATVLAYRGQFAEARRAIQHARSLSPAALWLATGEARIAITAHAFALADSLIANLPHDKGTEEDSLDLVVTSLFEQGRPREAAQVVDRARAHGKPVGTLEMVVAHQSGLLGDTRSAMRWYEQHTYHGPDLILASRIRADAARAFAWHHALEADAVAERADTTWLLQMADSIARFGALSYYARDWRLPYHVRGLVAMRAGRWQEASADFARAQFGISGFTRSNLLEARAELAQHHPARAITVLRNGLAGPLDAMGRYTPHTELEYWLAIAFQQAGASDSARVYADRVRTAWHDAEPDFVARLRTLP